ncbi:MAG TPA: hypothetical protein VMY42_06495, partial [Thermoguttaceae bacterium]|nr:hypothetical protein [Thermoguttaceae bacterium]
GNDYLDSCYGTDIVYGGYDDDYLTVVDGEGGDVAYGEDGYDVAYGDPDGYGGSSDYLDAEETYPGGQDGEALFGGTDRVILDAALSPDSPFTYRGLQDQRTLRRWRELLWFYTEWQEAS